MLIAGLAAAAFLTEGALLNWSALLITSAGLVSATKGGVGYMLFSIAMTIGRLTGDSVTIRIGDRATLFWGGVLAVAGFTYGVISLISPVADARSAVVRFFRSLGFIAPALLKERDKGKL